MILKIVCIGFLVYVLLYMFTPCIDNLKSFIFYRQLRRLGRRMRNLASASSVIADVIEKNKKKKRKK